MDSPPQADYFFFFFLLFDPTLLVSCTFHAEVYLLPKYFWSVAFSLIAASAARNNSHQLRQTSNDSVANLL